MQVDAGVRGAADALTLGTADEIAAGIDAGMGKGGPGGIKQRYRVNVERERARDAYDAEHRSAARGAGEFVGSVAGLFEGGSGLGVGVSSRLPIRVKGKLGEVMSEVKTIVKRDRVDERQVRKDVLGGYTVADHVTKGGKIVEAKFGPAASLTNRQRQAQREYGPLYRVDRWLPKHVGYVTGTIGAGAGATEQAVDRLR
jgi:hypothetical protein